MKENSEILENYIVRRPKTFCTYFQILRRLPNCAKNSAITESQNPAVTEKATF